MASPGIPESRRPLVPAHPANTGDDQGMHGVTTRNLSPAQTKRPPALAVLSRPANAGTNVYTIDPLGKSGKMPFLQKGKWGPSHGTIEPPALGRNWAWRQEREVKSSLGETAYDYGKLPQGRQRPTWNLHFGLNAARPTFGKMAAPQSAHSSPATLAHEMSMDKELFSPFRTTVEISLATPPPRSLPVWSRNHWEPDGPLMSESVGARPGTQSSRKIRTAEGGVPDAKVDHACLLHNLLGCMLCSTSERARKSKPVQMQSISDSMPDASGESRDPSFSESRQIEMHVEPSDVSTMFSAVDFGRVASPASGRQTPSKLIHARSCMTLDGTKRSLLILPEKWGPIKHLIKDEVQARNALHDKAQRQVLAESPKHIMRHLHAQMRNHPDSPWQPICFPVVQAGN
jgi:hypothetical protein